MKKSELVKLLKKNSCYKKQEGGNHEIWYSNNTKSKFIISRSPKEVSSRVVKDIKKQAGVK